MKPVQQLRRRVGLAVWAVAASAAWAGPAEPPAIPEAVSRLLAGRYLTDEERKDIRVRFGVWTEADLDTPARKARAALMVGRWDDPALTDPAADELDRAEAQVLRGEAAEALATLDGPGESKGKSPVRAARLRADALVLAGKGAEADKVVAGVLEQLRADGLRRADEAVEGVRCLMLRARLVDENGKPRQDADQFHAMMQHLTRAREQLDRLEWRTLLVEGQLLDEKDNAEQAHEALEQAAALAPASAWVKFQLGMIDVETFNLEHAENLAGEIEAGSPGSVLAAVVRARARLRQNDAAGAGEALKAALEKYPRQPRLLAVSAAATAAGFDFAKTDRLLAEYDAAFPGSAEAYLEVGRVLSEGRQYEASSKYLNEAAKRSPGWPEPVIELGLMELQAGRDTEAKRALEKAFALDPFNVRADNSLRLVNEMLTYASVESDHYIVRYKPGVDEILAKEMLDPLEANHRRVCGKEAGGIDHTPAVKTTIELMPDHQWFAVRIAGMPRIHTIAAATGPVIAMEAPREGSFHLVGNYDWVRVLRHEYTHTVTLSRTKNRLPHWFTEAAAVYLEDAPRDYSACRLLGQAMDAGALFDFDEINLAFVRPKKQSDRSQAYAQGHWMYQFIVEKWGARAPLDLMDKYALGEREAQAFKEVLGVERVEFMEQFKGWAKKQLVAWGIDPPEGMPTALELLKKESAGEKDAQPTAEMAERWLKQWPAHPDALELAVKFGLKKAGDKPTAELVPLLERYAAARPVDPLPHKTLASWYLSGEGARDAGAGAKVAEHLEYLDAREQHSPAYAMELSGRYGAAGDWEKAWAKALRAVRVAPYQAQTRELAATVAIKRKDWDAAKWQLEALARLEPDREIHKKRLEALQRLREAAK